MSKTLKRSRGARELDKLLDEEGPTAEAVRDAFHRTTLWRLRTGRRRAELESATLIQQRSKGRIKASWWLAA